MCSAKEAISQNFSGVKFRETWCLDVISVCRTVFHSCALCSTGGHHVRREAACQALYHHLYGSRADDSPCRSVLAWPTWRPAFGPSSIDFISTYLQSQSPSPVFGRILNVGRCLATDQSARLNTTSRCHLNPACKKCINSYTMRK